MYKMKPSFGFDQTFVIGLIRAINEIFRTIYIYFCLKIICHWRDEFQSSVKDLFLSNMFSLDEPCFTSQVTLHLPTLFIFKKESAIFPFDDIYGP